MIGVDSRQCNGGRVTGCAVCPAADTCGTGCPDRIPQAGVSMSPARQQYHAVALRQGR